MAASPRAALVLSLLILGASLPLVRADYVPPWDLPKVAGGTGPGAAWATIRFTTGPGEVALIAGVTGFDNVCMMGEIVYDEHGHALDGGIGEFSSVSESVTVNVGTQVLNSDHSLIPSSFKGDCASAAYVNVHDWVPQGPGTFLASFWMGGGNQSSWELRGDAVLVSSAAGPAIFAQANDLHGDASIGLGPAGVQAKGTLSVHAAHIPLDVVYTSKTRADVIARVGPQGSTTCRTPTSPYGYCFNYGLTENVLPPGDYAFHYTGAGADAQGETSIFFADAQLPP